VDPVLAGLGAAAGTAIGTWVARSDWPRCLDLSFRRGSFCGQTIWSKVQLGPLAVASLASHVISTASSRSAKATYAAS
jgi:hypothetical protein